MLRDIVLLAGAALSKTASTKVPLLVPTGQQVSPFTFTISGIGQ